MLLFVENSETCYPKSIPAANSRSFGNLSRTTGHQSSNLTAGFGLQYMKDNLRKELKTFTILPLVFQRGMEKINVLFVWVLYKLQFKVNWKHTL